MLPLRSISRLIPSLRIIAQNSILTASAASKQYTWNYGLVPASTAINQLQLDTVRCYAKGKQKEKARNKGVKFVTYKLPDEQLNEIVNMEKYRKQLQRAIDVLQSDYVKHLSLRSTTGSIETIKVKVDSEEHELQDIAQVIRKNPKTIVIDMIAFPQMIPAALQALQKSGLNVNPQQEGTTIYIPIPKVTKDHRTALAKNAKTLFIKCRDQIKDAQNEVIKKVKNNTEVSEDDSHAAQNQLTEMADTFVAQAEKTLETKQNELLNN